MFKVAKKGVDISIKILILNLTMNLPKIEYVPQNGTCVITAKFERAMGAEEIEMLRENYRAGVIKVNPDEDLSAALVAQFCRELQEAYDLGGMDGFFYVQAVLLNMAVKVENKG